MCVSNCVYIVLGQESVATVDSEQPKAKKRSRRSNQRASQVLDVDVSGQESSATSLDSEQPKPKKQSRRSKQRASQELAADVSGQESVAAVDSEQLNASQVLDADVQSNLLESSGPQEESVDDNANRANSQSKLSNFHICICN